MSTLGNSLVDRQRPCRTTPPCRRCSCRPTTRVLTDNPLSIDDSRVGRPPLFCHLQSLIVSVDDSRVDRELSCRSATLVTADDFSCRPTSLASAYGSLVGRRVLCRPTTIVSTDDSCQSTTHVSTDGFHPDRHSRVARELLRQSTTLVSTDGSLVGRRSR